MDDWIQRIHDAGGWAWDAVADPDFNIRLNRGYEFAPAEWETAYEKQVEHTLAILTRLREALTAAWVPVGERLPDNDRDVLTLVDGGESWDGTKYPPFCEIADYKPDRVGTMISGEVRPFPWNTPGVTHWMELPKPPADVPASANKKV